MMSKHYTCLRHISNLGKHRTYFDKALVNCVWRRNSSSNTRDVSSSAVAKEEPPRGGTSLEDASKPYTNKPFVKDLFIGKFDTGVLVYPEFHTTDEVQNLEAKVAPIEQFFKDEVDSSLIERNGTIPKETVDRLQSLGLFGQQIPTEYGGLGLSAKEYARFSEVIAQDGSIAALLSTHNDLAVQSILLSGTEEQKATYLPDLASGRLMAAYCLTETEGGSDLASIKLTADVSADGKTYKLNGSKQWVTNAKDADIFIVYAKTTVEILGEVSDSVTAFVVDKAAGGIVIGEGQEMLGVKGTKAYEVTFENTVVSVDDILGGLESGFQLAMTVLNRSRYFEGAAFSGILKKCIAMAAEHAIHTKRFKKPLTEFSLIQEKFGRIAIQMYAMESMAYLTAGVSDTYQNPDIGLESAIVKLFSQETARDCLHLCMEVFGASGYSTNLGLERLLRDAYTTSLIKGSGDILRLYIALLGVQHAGQDMAENIRKLNNPFYNVKFMLGRSFKNITASSKRPKLTHKLYDHVHPTLTFAAEDLETRVHQFVEILEFCLSAYEKDILEEQQTLKRFADIVTDIYAATAVLGRAGRSKSIGLRSADHEVLLAQVFTGEACQRIDALFKILREGKYCNGDDYKKEFAGSIFKSRGWAADSPLARNW